jgi:hypothetical protein
MRRRHRLAALAAAALGAAALAGPAAPRASAASCVPKEDMLIQGHNASISTQHWTNFCGVTTWRPAHDGIIALTDVFEIREVPNGGRVHRVWIHWYNADARDLRATCVYSTRDYALAVTNEWYYLRDIQVSANTSPC